MKNRRWVAALACFYLADCLAARAGTAPFFRPLGDENPDAGFFRQAFEVSGDGSTVIGVSDFYLRADLGFVVSDGLLWSEDTGLIRMGFDMHPIAVSHAGEVVVGTMAYSDPERPRRMTPFFWRASTGAAGVPSEAPPGSFNSVSADGGVAVGHLGPLGANPGSGFIWTPGSSVGGGVVAGGFLNEIRGVSADGKIMVGTIRYDDGRYVAARWRQESVFGSMLDLQLLGDSFGTIRDLSADGQAILGELSGQVFIWTQALGKTGIGFGYAGGISADGSVAVASTGMQNGAYIWDAVNGQRFLSSLFQEEFGFEVAGWDLHTVTGISDDGRTIVGYGTNPEGRWEAFIAQIPEPSGLFLMLIGAAGILLATSRWVWARAWRWKAWTWAALLASSSSLHAQGVEPSFTGLGFLDGFTDSRAYGVSGDGSVVVGTSGSRGFRWEEGAGMFDLGEGVSPTIVTPDGTQVFGMYQGDFYRWIESIGVAPLSYHASGQVTMTAVDANGLGFTTAGTHPTTGKPSGFAALVGFSPFVWEGGAFDMSNDGLSFVGYEIDSSAGIGPEAFLRRGMSGWNLGSLPGHDTSRALGISADGEVVVGDVPGTGKIWRWTETDGMSFVTLGYFGGISGDGSIIVGSAGDGVHGFIWDAAHEARDLATVLATDYGLDLGSWQLHTVTDISDDGTTIIGFGTNPYGQSEAFVIQIPEASSSVLMVLGAVGILIAVSAKRRPRRNIHKLCIGVLLIFSAMRLPAETPFFRPLGTENPDAGYFSQVLAISGDGSTVVGVSTPYFAEELGLWVSDGLRWNRQTGLERISADMRPLALTFDGSQVVGWMGFTYNGTRRETAFWFPSALGGPEVTAQAPWGAARDISATGSVVVGQLGGQLGLGIGGGLIWRQHDGYRGYWAGIQLAPGYVNDIRAISADGTVMAGNIIFPDGHHEIVTWHAPAEDLFENVRTLGPDSGVAQDISADGRFILADSLGRVVRWNEIGQNVEVGAGYAGGISGNGAVVVAFTGERNGAYIWDASTGQIFLSELFAEEFGFQTEGWDLHTVTGISDDGRTIAGFGTNPYGQTEAWIAHIPEPMSIVTLAIGLLALAGAIGFRGARA